MEPEGKLTEQEPEEWEERLRAAVEKTLLERERKKAEREMFAERRKHGLAARHAAKLARLNKEKTMTRPTNQCRYLTRNGNQCTGEPVDIGVEAEALLCTRHIGNVLELLKARGFTITAPAADWCDDCKHVCPRCEREVCGCPSLDQVRYMRGDKEYIP